MWIRIIIIFVLFFSSTISTFSQTNKIKRFNYKLNVALGARVPLNDSYINLWKYFVGNEKFTVPDDGLYKQISEDWTDYFFSFLGTDFDFIISENLSIGLFAYPDKYKKTLTKKGQTNNWTGEGSGALESKWELKRKLRIATYNFGPDIKFKIPYNDFELSLSYLYGLSYLWRSSYEFSYSNALTGTGERGFLGLFFVSDGNIAKFRFTGSSDFHRVELGINRFESKGGNGSTTLKIGYQFLKMDNIKYKVLKYNREYYYEAGGYFNTGELAEYQVGDSGDIYIDNNKFNIDLSCFYITLLYSWHW